MTGGQPLPCMTMRSGGSRITVCPTTYGWRKCGSSMLDCRMRLDRGFGWGGRDIGLLVESHSERNEESREFWPRLRCHHPLDSSLSAYSASASLATFTFT